jgi:type I restriction enzyme S subunit
VNYQPYPAYGSSVAATGIAFPGGWPVERLRFSILSNPVRSEVAHWDDETAVSFVPMDAVGEQGEIDPSQEKPLADVYNGYTYFLENDILIAKITPCFENGKGAIARGLKNGVGFGTTEFHVLRPLQGMSERWLYYLTKCDFFRKIGGSEMLGAGGQKRLPEEFIRNLRVGIPSFSEQERIAAFLDWKTGQVDALIAKKQALIEKLKEKRLAVITQAVTKGLDPSAPLKDTHIPWLGEVPKHWDIPSLKMRYTVELGKMLDEKKIVGDQLIPYLRNTDVQWDRINFDELPEMDISEEEYQRYTIREDDVLVCEGGEVGRAAIVGKCDEVFGYQKALHRLRAVKRNESPRFIYYTLLWAVGTGVFSVEGASTIAHLTADQLRRYRFPQPPEDEQLDIVDFLDQVLGRLDKMHEKINNAIARLTEYRTALITAATTGQIDVRNVAIPAHS